LGLGLSSLFRLLSRESETEHHAASNMVDWLVPVIESIFGYLEVYTSSVVETPDDLTVRRRIMMQFM